MTLSSTSFARVPASISRMLAAVRHSTMQPIKVHQAPPSSERLHALARACTRLRCANCLHHLYGASKAHAGCLWRCGGAGSGDAVRVLLQNKADKDRTNHDGNTAAKLMQTSQMVDKESKARMLEMLHGAPSQGKQGGCVIC